MAILSNIGAALFLIAIILLILCIISFFKKNGKAKQYGRPTVILFMISIVLIITGVETSNHPIVEFFTILSFVLFIFFLVLALLSVIKKTGVAKTIYHYSSIVCHFVALTSISTPSSEKQQQLARKLPQTMKNKKITKRKRTRKERSGRKTRKQEDENASRGTSS